MTHTSGSLASSPPPDLDDDERDALERIAARLREQTGLDSSGYDQSTVLRRIGRRLEANDLETLTDYEAYLEDHDGELDALYGDLLVGVSEFFRDREAWAALDDHVLPKLFAGKTDRDQIRVWVPGCSTGEEACTVALLLARRVETIESPPKITIFGTDLDGDAIAAARRASYPAESLSAVPERLHTRYFRSEGARRRLVEKVRRWLVFGRHDAITDPPLADLDLVTCRNLLIYLTPEAQRQLLDRFHYALSADGYLMLGESESAAALSDRFEGLDGPHPFYRPHTEHPPDIIDIWTPFRVETPDLDVDTWRRSVPGDDRQAEGTCSEDATVEQLQASREALMARNEELQSTVEELRTSLQKLRSANQRLDAKNDQLETANADLRNLMRATDLGTIFLDRDLRIRHFTEPVTDYVPLIPEDEGRPFDHIAHNLETDDLVANARRAMERSTKIEYEAETEDNGHLLIRLFPYLDADDRVDGVVLTLVDITDYKTTIAEKHRAERLAELRSQFLSTLDHDVRSPLTAILTLTHLLKQKVDGEHDELVERIEQSTDQIRKIVGSFLRMANVEVDQTPVQSEAFDLVTDIDRLVDVHRAVADRNDLELSYEGPESPVEVELDPRFVAQILNNLLDNAITYTDDGEVNVRLEGDDEHVRIEVADTGPGIPESDRERIFERNETGDHATHADHSEGLGLAISRRLAETMDGTISLDSTVGEGSTFVVELPRRV